MRRKNAKDQPYPVPSLSSFSADALMECAWAKLQAINPVYGDLSKSSLLRTECDGLSACAVTQLTSFKRLFKINNELLKKHLILNGLVPQNDARLMFSQHTEVRVHVCMRVCVSVGGWVCMCDVRVMCLCEFSVCVFMCVGCFFKEYVSVTE